MQATQADAPFGNLLPDAANWNSREQGTEIGRIEAGSSTEQRIGTAFGKPPFAAVAVDRLRLWCGGGGGDRGRWPAAEEKAGLLPVRRYMVRRYGAPTRWGPAPAGPDAALG